MIAPRRVKKKTKVVHLLQSEKRPQEESLVLHPDYHPQKQVGSLVKAKVRNGIIFSLKLKRLLVMMMVIMTMMERFRHLPKSRTAACIC